MNATRPSKAIKIKTARNCVPCLTLSLESTAYFFAYQSEFNAVNDPHFSGKSSNAKIAVTGHTGTHAPQSMHSVGLIYSWVTPSCSGSSFRGWMQSTGHTSTQAESLVPIHGSAIT